MSDPVPSSAISDATTGGLSLIVITGGSTGQVLTQQSDGTYAPATVSAGIGGSVGSTDNRLVRSDGTGGSTVQSTGITVDDSDNVSGVATLAISGNITFDSPHGITSNNWTRVSGSNLPTRGLAIRDSQLNFASNMTMYWSTSLDPTGNADGGSIAMTGGSLVVSGPICAGTYTVGTLPSAAASAYKFATVSDSSVTTFGSTVAGGGSSKVMVFSNGTNWTVFAI